MKHKKASKTMPKGEARPPGTPAPKRSKLGKVANFFRKEVDTPPQEVVGSAVEQLDSAQAIPPVPTQPAAGAHMTLTKKGYSRNGRSAIYNAGKGTVRITRSLFVGNLAPDFIDVADGIFAAKTEKVAKVKLTKEQRAALPKPTLAEKIERRRQALAKLEAKAAEQHASL